MYLSLKRKILSLVIVFVVSTKAVVVVDLAWLIVLWCLGWSVMGKRAPSHPSTSWDKRAARTIWIPLHLFGGPIGTPSGI